MTAADWLYIATKWVDWLLVFVGLLAVALLTIAVLNGLAGAKRRDRRTWTDRADAKRRNQARRIGR